MNPLRRLFRPLQSLFGKGRLERDMTEEIRFHLEQRAADQAAEGLSPEEARYAAERRFGNVARIQEQARADRGWTWLENFVKDLQLGVRSLLKSPGFTLVAILTLGLGIGANTSMFSMLNGVLLKPLPYPEADQLDRIFRATAQTAKGNLSPADYIDLERAKSGYGDVAAYTAGSLSLAEPGHPAEMAYAAQGTVNLLPLLGVTPQLGRGFRSGEDVAGRDRVVILSQRTWLNRFGGREDAIGRTIRLDGTPHEVIGVLPASFNDWRHLGVVDLIRPLALTPAQSANRTANNLRVVGRRPPDRSKGEAYAFLASLGERLAREHPDANAGSSWRPMLLQKTAWGDGAQTVLPMVIGLSGFVLLIACSNLANLLLARAMASAREFAVRAALGASRLQLLRPLIAEALLLAFAGGGVALLVAHWFRDWAAVRSRGDNGESVFFEVDWHVMGWAFAASLATALVFGLAPALFAMRLDLNATLKSGARGSTGSRIHQRFRQGLIVGQFAFAMVLLAGAGLFMRGLHDINNRRTGWESTHLVTGTILLPSGAYADDEKINAFHRLVLERLLTLPGVEAASVSAYTPFFDWTDLRRFLVEGHDRPAPGKEPAAMVNRVTAGYFDTVGTRLVSGRTFTDRDDAGSERVFVINQTAAHGLFGDENPLGRRLAALDGGQPEWGEVVGVVTDVKSVEPDSRPVPFQVYKPMAQEPRLHNEIAVRTGSVPGSAIIDRIRAIITELDPDLPVRKLQPAEITIHRINYQLEVLRDMLGGMAILGLGLASLGVYGVIARTMAQRTAEFAIRLALGAGIGNITRLVLASGVKLALLGSTLGLAGAFGVARVISFTFPGLRTDGVGVLVATTVLLVAVSLLACWLPARRAGKVDAMTVLRAE